MSEARPQIIYQPRGPCAILASARGIAFDPFPPPVVSVSDDTAMVDIRGPLTHHFSYGTDNYESILLRVADVCKTQAKTVILAIDSPGGDVYGVFETARGIRAMCDQAGKTLVTYISGAGASAAYALACAADRIYASDVSCVGSIGVIDTMISVVRQDTAMGVDTATITSGERKADGNPHVALSKEAMAAHQAHVDDLAAVFYAWVAERRGLSPAAVQGLEAAVFVGAKAIDAGLIDQVADFRSLQEILKNGTIDAIARNVPQGNSMKPTFAQVQAMFAASKFTDAMAALAAMAEEGEGDDKDKAKKAMKKMLADDKPEASDDDKDAKKAEGDKPAEDKKEPEKAQAAASVPGADFDVVAAVKALQATNVKTAEDAERATLLASRPDLMADATIKASLMSASLETVKEICRIVPKAKFTAPATPAAPTLGAPGTSVHGLPADESARLKAEMGLTPYATATVTQMGDLVVFGGTSDQIQTLKAEKGIQ